MVRYGDNVRILKLLKGFNSWIDFIQRLMLRDELNNERGENNKGNVSTCVLGDECKIYTGTACLPIGALTSPAHFGRRKNSIEDCLPIQEFGRLESCSVLEYEGSQLNSELKNTPESCSTLSTLARVGACTLNGVVEGNAECLDTSKLCLCQIAKHNSHDSCWLLVGHSVYDVTTFLNLHPAGAECIVRHSGGYDCQLDMEYHSKKAQKMWKKYKIGNLVPCDDQKRLSKPSCGVM